MKVTILKTMIFHGLYCRKCYLFFVGKLPEEPCRQCGFIMRAVYHKDNKFSSKEMKCQDTITDVKPVEK
jgi:hypothetical protein